MLLDTAFPESARRLAVVSIQPHMRSMPPPDGFRPFLIRGEQEMGVLDTPRTDHYNFMRFFERNDSLPFQE